MLQTGEFIRVGSSKVQKTDVRVVAATNTDLMQAIAAGRFREDLYYRPPQYGARGSLPGLRERPGDISAAVPQVRERCGRAVPHAGRLARPPRHARCR